MTLENHPVKILWEHHAPTAGYPAGVVRVPEIIPGTAFFPGGHGLWGTKANTELPEFPVGGVMILGHDFHSESGYKKSLVNGSEPETQPTWNRLLKLLRDAGVPLEKCFFTNFYMGLRQGDATTGVFPGASDEKFKQHCSDLFIEQLNAMRPSLILTLGKYVPNLIAPLSEELSVWRDSKGFRDIDTAGPLKTHCHFAGVSDFETTVVALVHPSFRHASVGIRHYGGREGSAAEEQMLTDALSDSHIAIGAKPNQP